MHGGSCHVPLHCLNYAVWRLNLVPEFECMPWRVMVRITVHGSMNNVVHSVFRSVIARLPHRYQFHVCVLLMNQC